ncbi:MAG: carbohydrate ABC transporter permease [Planctomycetota bacterium]|nr:carbohydrate ABC transporter permease [Planctomycetota bacterium]
MTRGSDGMDARAGRVGLLACYILVIVATVIIAVPFVWLVCASFKSNADFLLYPFLPRGEGVLGVAWDRLTLDHFRSLFREAGVGRALLNSLVLSSVTAVLATLVCAMGGYALASLEFAGRRLVSNVVMAAVVIPSPLLIAPGFQVLYRLGLLDSYAGLILPAIAPAFGVYLFRQATLSSVPRELLEAARMDACGEVRAFFRVVFPLVQPMVAAFLLMTFLATWNNFLSPQVVLQTPEKMPLAVMIAQLKNVYYQDYGLLMAGTLASILPVGALFLLLQKDFVTGLTSGAVKG